MHHHSATTDRRRSKRFKAHDNAFAILHSDNIIVTSLIDISMDGLSFEYIPEGENLPCKGCGLDVFFTDDKLYDFYLQNMPFETISEIPVEHEPPASEIKIKRFSVKFGELSSTQKAQLEFFLRCHTMHEA